ncbi:glycosyltransferase family 2 protein [Bacillus mexicanus]|uniref:glycosyltransferase family 2 protein n=1 Tax=Bacillus TaxID=1386 RepID=UPI00138A3FE8|nr:glycosyltransferase [Bacillus sp. SKDU12]
MKASVIIPAYNSKERLYNSLLSLNQQECDETFEVIVADNGSEDGTLSMLESFQANFPLTIVRIEQNRGIAYGRNQAIRKAKGDILIFHDSDMLAEKEHVAKHIQAHESGEKLVVCGLFWKRIYSFYYENFEEENKKQIAEQFGAVPSKDKQRLLQQSDIKSGAFLEKSYDLDIDFVQVLKKVLEHYGDDLNGYHMPWRFFITNNSSVKRKHVEDVGLFDEGIVKYGFEDYDLGIKLHKAGMVFKIRRDIISVHQEHPSNSSIDDIRTNIAYMCDKYNDIYSMDVHLVFNGPFYPIMTNNIMGDIQTLHQHPQYAYLLEEFLKLLQIVRYRNLNPDWHEKGTEVTVTDFDANRVKTLLYDAKQRIGIHDFVIALTMLASDLLQIDLK